MSVAAPEAPTFNDADPANRPPQDGGVLYDLEAAGPERSLAQDVIEQGPLVAESQTHEASGTPAPEEFTPEERAFLEEWEARHSGGEQEPAPSGLFARAKHTAATATAKVRTTLKLRQLERQERLSAKFDQAPQEDKSKLRQTLEFSLKNPMIAVSALGVVAAASWTAYRGLEGGNNLLHTEGHTQLADTHTSPVHVTSPDGITTQHSGHTAIVDPDTHKPIIANTKAIEVDEKGHFSVTDDQWKKLHKNDITAVHSGEDTPAQTGAKVQTTDDLHKLNRIYTPESGGQDLKNARGLDIRVEPSSTGKGNDVVVNVKAEGGTWKLNENSDLKLMVTDSKGHKVMLDLPKPEGDTRTLRIPQNSQLGKILGHDNQYAAEVINGDVTPAHDGYPATAKVVAAEMGHDHSTLPDEVTIPERQAVPTLEFMQVENKGGMAHVITPEGVASIKMPKGYELHVLNDELAAQTGRAPGHIAVMYHGNLIGDVPQDFFAHVGPDGKLDHTSLEALQQGHQKGLPFTVHHKNGVYQLVPEKAQVVPAPTHSPTHESSPSPSTTTTPSHSPSSSPTPTEQHQSASPTPTDHPATKHTTSHTPTHTSSPHADNTVGTASHEDNNHGGSAWGTIGGVAATAGIGAVVAPATSLLAHTVAERPPEGETVNLRRGADLIRPAAIGAAFGVFGPVGVGAAAITGIANGVVAGRRINSRQYSPQPGGNEGRPLDPFFQEFTVNIGSARYLLKTPESRTVHTFDRGVELFTAGNDDNFSNWVRAIDDTELGAIWRNALGVVIGRSSPDFAYDVDGHLMDNPHNQALGYAVRSLQRLEAEELQQLALHMGLIPPPAAPEPPASPAAPASPPVPRLPRRGDRAERSAAYTPPPAPAPASTADDEVSEGPGAPAAPVAEKSLNLRAAEYLGPRTEGNTGQFDAREARGAREYPKFGDIFSVPGVAEQLESIPKIHHILTSEQLADFPTQYTDQLVEIGRALATPENDGRELTRERMEEILRMRKAPQEAVQVSDERIGVAVNRAELLNWLRAVAGVPSARS